MLCFLLFGLDKLGYFMFLIKNKNPTISGVSTFPRIQIFNY